MRNHSSKSKRDRGKSVREVGVEQKRKKQYTDTFTRIHTYHAHSHINTREEMRIEEIEKRSEMSKPNRIK